MDKALLVDFVTLPLIAITPSDWEISTTTNDKELTAVGHSNMFDPVRNLEPMLLHWSTGFNIFVDDIWSKMSGAAKGAVRDACVEVLRRTETEQVIERSWEDNDAHLLD